MGVREVSVRVRPLQVGHQAGGDDAAGGDGLERKGRDCRVGRGEERVNRAHSPMGADLVA